VGQHVSVDHGPGQGGQPIRGTALVGTDLRQPNVGDPSDRGRGVFDAGELLDGAHQVSDGVADPSGQGQGTGPHRDVAGARHCLLGEGTRLGVVAPVVGGPAGDFQGSGAATQPDRLPGIGGRLLEGQVGDPNPGAGGIGVCGRREGECCGQEVLGGVQVEPGCGGCGGGGEWLRRQGGVTAGAGVHRDRQGVGAGPAGQGSRRLLVEQRPARCARGRFERLSDQLVAELEAVPALDDEAGCRRALQMAEDVRDRRARHLGDEL
jgi:hypothetical protein